MRTARLLFSTLLAFGCLAARADELHLKDGTKLIGTIVGYQGSAFRVKTSYGYALVERSSVISITVTPNSASAEKKSRAEEKSAAKTESRNQDPKDPPNKRNAYESASSQTPDAPTNSASATNSKFNSAPNRASQPVPANQTAASPARTSAAPAGAGNSAAVNETASAPTPMREKVLDNLYVNETYGFQLYKPPDWQLIQDARAALPGAIAALGTSDQSTYLIIGLEPANDTLLAHVTVTNDRLADSFDNFRPTELRQTLIAGFPAVEYQFQGMAGNHLWAGTVALVRRAENTYTIFGVTTATSDLVQIQQNVISRAIASLQFTNR